jgi:hypothetical protein
MACQGYLGTMECTPWIPTCSQVLNTFFQIQQIKNRYVCLPRKQSFAPVCGKMATLESSQDRCLHLQPPRIGGLYANPLKSDHPMASKTKGKKDLKCLVIVPFWVGSAWWSPLPKLGVPNTPVVKVNPYVGMFQSCLGQNMPKPRWHLIFLLCSGSRWRNNKGRLKPSLTI